jgi:hypothetical protein
MQSTVEIADRYSRKRPALVAAAALAFLAIHVLLRPLFYAHGADAAIGGRSGIDWWAINVVALLAALATGGGLAHSRQIRVLLNDEVSRSHYKTSVAAGYWVAMVTAVALYLLPHFAGFNAREAVFLIVTPSVIVPLLTFAYLEFRANRDG